MILLFVLLIALVPAVALAPLFFWARRLQRRSVAPRSAILAALALVALGGVLTACGVVLSTYMMLVARPIESDGPSQKARALAEGISEAMNNGVFALLFALAAAALLAFAKWRERSAATRDRDGAR